MWVHAATDTVLFSFSTWMRIWVTVADLKEHSEVERIRKMEISTQEKIRLLKTKEKDILTDIAHTKYMAIGNYAERSEGIKMDTDDLGQPDGVVSWDMVLDLTSENVVE